jgi:serine/threonine-protein kinase
MAAVAALAATGAGSPELLSGLVAPEPVPYPEQSRNGAGAERYREERNPWLPWLIGLLVLALIAAAAAAAYFISRPKQRPVPTVVGYQYNVAQVLLERAGFTVSQVPVTSSRHPQGIVVGEDPSAGSKADKGSNVTLSVSEGAGNTTIPSVVGLSEAAARRELRRSKLKSRIETQTSQQYPAGRAISTDPASGQTVGVGTAVTLFISSGQAKKQVPNVVGQDQATAAAELTAAGFNVRSTQQVSTTVQPGNVISQSPAANTSATPGQSVALVVAKAPPMIAVPRVVGDTPTQAASTLTTAGFKVHKQRQAVSERSQAGLVLSQSPSASTKVQQGSTVTIVVGKFVASKPPTTTTTTPTTPTTSTTTTPTTTTSTTPTGAPAQ